MGILRNGLEGFGDILAFTGRLYRGIFGGRVLKFMGEVLRQAGILIIGSVAIIMLLVFILGLQCGIEGAYASRTIGSPSVAGAFTALCDLREVTPYAFGYMMAAKVGTGFVAELGSMRISDEIDALEVLGLDSLVYLCATRLLGMWLVLPFVYITAIAIGFLGSYVAVVRQIGEVSPGGYLEIFWQFQNPIDLIFSAIKGMTMATFIVIVGCYYGFTAGGGPVGVGRATAQSMVVNILGIHAIGMLGTQLFWGGNPRAPIGG
jgi:phospholipid/cholesterol/gamma-HCH transport system permease protein